MPATIQTAPVSKKRIWAGRVFSTLPVLLLLQYGYPEHLLGILGVVEMLCAILYVIPRTSIFGAIVDSGGGRSTH